MVTRPCFLVGAERSGTTMFRLMLSHHPQLAWLSALEFGVDKLAAHPDGWPPLAEYHEYLVTHRIFNEHGFEIDPKLGYPELVDSFLVQHQQRTGNRPVVGAVVLHHFDQLTRIWPDARFIHILRDGRDVSRSSIGMGWASNVWTGADRWVTAELTWAAMLPHLTADRILEVRYENLVSNPESELRRTCEFLGVAYDPSMLDYSKSTQTYEKPDPKLIAQWRTKLKPEEIRLVEARIGSMLVERGYELSGLAPLEVDAAMQQRLRRQDRWARIRHRWKLFGARLFVEDYIARRLGGPKSWRHQVQRRVNARVETTLRH